MKTETLIDWTTKTAAVLLTTVATLPITALESVDRAVAEVMNEWQAPGAAVVVIEDGVVIHSAGYGFADPEQKVPVDIERTVFRLASLSKPVTASALLRLHQEGRLDLEAPVSMSLRPRIETGDVLSTLHLLTHTAGFEDRFLDRLTRDVSDLLDLGDYLASDLPAQRYVPGDVALYSNHGLALAGLVAAEVCDKDFGDAMRELVFEPLGMASTSFDPRHAGPTLAVGYREGVRVPVYGIKTVPASMLASTAQDMTRFLKALVVPEETGWLDGETVELMLRRHFDHHPSFTGRALGLAEDSSVTPRRLLHSGATDGFSSALVVVPEHRGGIFVVFTANAYVWGLVGEILDEVFPAQPRPVADRTVEGGVAAAEASGRYVPAEVPRESIDTPRLLFEQAVAEAESAEVLTFRGQSYQRRQLGEYRAPSGRTIVVRRGQRGEQFLIEDGRVWVRLPWYRSWPIHLTLLILALSAFGFLAVRGSSAFVRLAALANISFVVGTGTVFGIALAQDGGPLRFGVPWYLDALLALPWVALALTLVASGHAAVRLRRGGSAAAGGWRLGLALLLLLAFMPYLGFWSLL